MPEVPAVPGTAIDARIGRDVQRRSVLRDGIAVAFSGRGALAHVVDGYEPREGQRRMAEAVAAVIADGGTLLAEAVPAPERRSRT